MEGNSPTLDTTMLEYENLPEPPTLDESLLMQLDSHIKGSHWSASHQCITMIRSIIKYYPQFIPDLFVKYGPAVMDLLGHAAPLLLKNILKLLREVFNCGGTVNVEGCVSAFLPVLVRKAANETGHVKQTCQEVLTIITTSCCYPSTIEIATQLSCDKAAPTAELAIKLLSIILQNLSGALTQLSPNTLQILMRGLSHLIDGKRNNMKTSALDICQFIYSQIGNENFIQLVNYSLPENAVGSMGLAMQTHRTQKEKAPPIIQKIKQIRGQRQSNIWGSIRS